MFPPNITPPPSTTSFVFPPAEIAAANAQLEEWTTLIKKGKHRTKEQEKRMNDLWEEMTVNIVGM